jgi:hypothetical protein
VQDFRPLSEKVRIPTLALSGEDDDYIDPVKNPSLLAGFKSPQRSALFVAQGDERIDAGGPVRR